MKVLGIVSEYNPFHNGHAYHIRQSKEICGECIVVCVMSGNFIQRGEPAVADKWARAEIALLNGVDLVLELPTVYAMSSAEYFGYAAVKILDSLGVVDYLSFGSECGELEILNAAAAVLIDEPEQYSLELQENLSSGLSFPAARSNSLASYFKTLGLDPANLQASIASSNNILGIEYLKALKRLNSSIKPVTVKRCGSEYNSPSLAESHPSATAVRNELKKKGSGSFNTELAGKLPLSCISILEREFSAGRGPVFSEHFENLILSLARSSGKEALSRLPYVSEGLENRIYNAALSSGSFEELIEGISTRRYTRTRIQRLLFHLLTGLTAEDFRYLNECGGPQYLRVLGFNQKGKELLPLIKAAGKLPLVVKTSDFIEKAPAPAVKLLNIEARSTDNYVLGFNNLRERVGNKEFTTSPVIIS